MVESTESSWTIERKAVGRAADDLRNLLDKSAKPLKTVLAKLKNVTAPRVGPLKTFINFGITVEQTCDHLEDAQLCEHFNHPMLMQELVDKLPPRYTLNWVFDQSLCS